VEKMKKYLALIVLATVIAVTLSYGQIGGGGGPFSSPAPPAGSGQNGPYSNGGGGINPNDITPPPDPIDTPIDAGLIYLLIIGLAYGITKMKKQETMEIVRK
jgi:hypothetical protein